MQSSDAIIAFLADKWVRKREYRLIKEVCAFHDNQIAARFAYEYHGADGNWFRAHGNEQWRFDAAGLMSRREARINDVPIGEGDRLLTWTKGPRPDDFLGLTDLGL